ncbi:MAG: hypothetical protein CME80_14620 [Halomonas sp.]|nr:hypothetical protein [Halomonas sp.]
METAALPIELLACIVVLTFYFLASIYFLLLLLLTSVFSTAYTTAGAMVAEKPTPDNPFFTLERYKNPPKRRDKKSELRSLDLQYGAHGRN